MTSCMFISNNVYVVCTADASIVCVTNHGYNVVLSQRYNLISMFHVGDHTFCIGNFIALNISDFSTANGDLKTSHILALASASHRFCVAFIVIDLSIFVVVIHCQTKTAQELELAMMSSQYSNSSKDDDHIVDIVVAKSFHHNSIELNTH